MRQPKVTSILVSVDRVHFDLGVSKDWRTVPVRQRFQCSNFVRTVSNVLKSMREQFVISVRIRSIAFTWDRENQQILDNKVSNVRVLFQMSLRSIPSIRGCSEDPQRLSGICNALQSNYATGKK